MDIATIIIAVSSLIAGIIAGVISWNNSKRQLKKSELDDLRIEVGRLQKRLGSLEDDYDRERTNNATLYSKLLEIQKENAWLKIVLAKHDIEIPPRPKDF